MKYLIVGFGKMGKIHAKYLTKKNMEWYWSDPLNQKPEDKKVNIKNVSSFDRVLICTPENMHYQNYKEIRNLGFKGYVFIEKPAAITHQHLLEISQDKKAIIGMVERFNPAVQTLKNLIDPQKIINIDFSRCCVSSQSSDVSILEDIGIHDIDLLFYLLNLENIKKSCIYNQNNTIIYMSFDPMCRMIWSKNTFFKERKIIVRQTDCTYYVDLIDQIVIKHYYINNQHVSEHIYVEKGSAISNELDNFISKNPMHIDFYTSHNYMLNLVKKLK